MGACVEGSIERAVVGAEVSTQIPACVFTFTHVPTHVLIAIAQYVAQSIAYAFGHTAASSRDLIAPAEACLAMAAIRMIARLTQSCIIAKQNWPNELAKQT